MVNHYRTYNNTYLCNQIIQAKEIKMVSCAGDVTCLDCLTKIQDYENDKYNFPIPFNHKQLSLTKFEGMV